MGGFWRGVFKNNYMVIRGVLRYIRFCLGEVLTPVYDMFNLEMYFLNPEFPKYQKGLGISPQLFAAQ